MMSTTPILPHLNFRCRIVGGVSSEPLPWGGWATSGALGVDTHYQRVGREEPAPKGGPKQRLPNG